ncbi:MAG: DUF1573 domain-containing protein [Bacteroidia bacterium]|nr:DUF1573 domain-containing protein [Bacteroidia bacterium]
MSRINHTFVILIGISIGFCACSIDSKSEKEAISNTVSTINKEQDVKENTSVISTKETPVFNSNTAILEVDSASNRETRESISELDKVENEENELGIPKREVPAKKKKKARIEFSGTTYDFGEIEEGDQISHTFKFQNTGKQPLVIKDVQVSCGCTVPSYPFIPIDPGDTGEIKIIFNSKGKFGTQKPLISVLSNAENPQVKLYLSGDVKHVFEQSKTIDTVQQQQ